MHATGKNFFGTLAVTLLAATGLIGSVGAHDGHNHGGAQHGGVEAKTKRHHFEVVFTKAGATLYAHGTDHEAIDASRLSATATFYHPNAPEKPWFSRQLTATGASPGHAHDSLNLAIDLSKAPAKGAKVSFRVAGLIAPAEPEAAFTVPLSFAGPGELSITTATAADRKAITDMRLCPVSHEELGSMGTPLKVSRGGSTTFLCCKGCLKELQANPDKFLGSSAASAKDAAKDAAKHDHHDH